MARDLTLQDEVAQLRQRLLRCGTSWKLPARASMRPFGRQPRRTRRDQRVARDDSGLRDELELERTRHMREEQKSAKYRGEQRQLQQMIVALRSNWRRLMAARQKQIHQMDLLLRVARDVAHRIRSTRCCGASSRQAHSRPGRRAALCF